MNTRLTILFITLLVAGCSKSETLETTTAKGVYGEILKVYEEPMHQLVFENESFKIIDVQIPAGDTTLFHLHEDPMLFVSQGFQRNSTQILNSPEWLPGDPWERGGVQSDLSYLEEPLKHRVTNLGNDLSRLIGIINMSEEMIESPAQGNFEVSDNWFRVKRLFLDPGDRINFRELPFPTVLILVSDGSLQIQDSGDEIDIDTIWHVLENDQELINTSNDKIEVIHAEVLNKGSAP